MALAAALYLYDSSALLYRNEALLSCSASGRWHAAFGWTRFVIAGRSLVMLNPFTVGQPAFRLQWQFEAAVSAAPDTGWQTMARRLIGLRWSARGAACGLFVLLPLGLFTPLGAGAIWAAVLFIYGSAIFGVIHLWILKDSLGLTAAGYAALAFECLVCPPFAANMIRRIALRQRITESFPHAAANLLRGEQRLRARAQCEARLDEVIIAVEGPGDAAALQARKAQISQWLEGA